MIIIEIFKGKNAVTEKTLTKFIFQQMSLKKCFLPKTNVQEEVAGVQFEPEWDVLCDFTVS